MSHLYVACELGPEKGRVMLGALQKEGLTVSEAGSVHDVLQTLEGITQWNVPTIYQQVLAAARSIVAQDEPVRGISFHSSSGDILLLDANGSLVPPAKHFTEAAGAGDLARVLSKVPLAEIYQETGVQPAATSAWCQFVSESGRRLRKAAHALDLADAFNFLLSGVPRFELSQASQTLLYNSASKEWSERLTEAAGVPRKLLPPLVGPGTLLGQTRPDIAREAGLIDARVVTTCSFELAASLAALSIADRENWAFLSPGHSTILGTALGAPFINEISRDMKYSNVTLCAETFGFYKSWTGLRLVEECHRAWSKQDRALDGDVLMHLATSATPFEALIDPADPRFDSAEDMPQAIQAFCRQTEQEPPRKPGPVLRCVLESLALHYRKALLELEYITGTNFSRLYVLGGQSNLLLNHFLANALQIPVVIAPSETAATGNVALQALTLGHIESVEDAQQIVSHCLRGQSINPHATAWTAAYDRFLGLHAA